MLCPFSFGSQLPEACFQVTGVENGAQSWDSQVCCEEEKELGGGGRGVGGRKPV